MVLENRCTLPLQSTLFALVAHPSDALFAVGYSNGVVETFRTPCEKNGLVKSVWRTARHKGSCRCLDFSSHGNDLYTAGTDMILKHCRIETGVVVSKMALSGADADGERSDAPSSLCALSPDHLLLGTDSGALYVFDIRQNGVVNPKPVAKFAPHGDYVSSITALPGSAASASGFPRQWVTTGETTVAYTDLRRGVIERSEDQGDEMLCAALVPSGLGPKKKRDNPVLLVGGNSGVVTLWDHGSWDDQQDRINVCASGKGMGAAARAMAESVDCVVYVPEDLGWGHYAMAGASDGNIYQINLKRKAVEVRLKHDEEDGVTAVVMDSEKRLISGGGSVVKIWEENEFVGHEQDDEDDDDADDDGHEEGGSDGDGDAAQGPKDTDSDEPATKKMTWKEKRWARKRKRAAEPAFPGID